MISKVLLTVLIYHTNIQLYYSYSVLYVCFYLLILRANLVYLFTVGCGDVYIYLFTLFSFVCMNIYWKIKKKKRSRS